MGEVSTYTEKLALAGDELVPGLSGSTKLKIPSRAFRGNGGGFPYKGGSNQYITQGINNAALTTIAGVTNRMEIYPWIAPFDMTINRLAVVVTTFGTGVAINLGIYDADDNGRPTSLLASAPAVSAAANGVSTGDITPLAVKAGKMLYLAVQSSGSATYNAVNIGDSYTLDFGSTPTSSPSKGFRRTYSYSNGLPNPWGWQVAEGTLLTPIAVFMRIA